MRDMFEEAWQYQNGWTRGGGGPCYFKKLILQIYHLHLYWVYIWEWNAAKMRKCQCVHKILKNFSEGRSFPRVLNTWGLYLFVPAISPLWIPSSTPTAINYSSLSLSRSTLDLITLEPFSWISILGLITFYSFFVKNSHSLKCSTHLNPESLP